MLIARPGLALRHLLAAACAAVALAGCGSAPAPATSSASAARPYAVKDPRPATTGTPTPADFRRPLAVYRGHVRHQLGAMVADVRALRAAVARRDLGGARAAWLAADGRYERIGAAYGAFGALDRRINGTRAGLPGGARSARFTGLHRVELALWGRRSTRDATRPAARLERDARRLRDRTASMAITPLDYGLRVHEILEDALHVGLAGAASPWSGSALRALDANVAGTRVILRTLRPMIAHRDPLVLAQADRALDRLDGALRGLRRGSRLPRWDRLGRRDRERVSGLTAAAAERLAYLPPLVDPRPPRPSQRSAEPAA